MLDLKSKVTQTMLLKSLAPQGVFFIAILALAAATVQETRQDWYEYTKIEEGSAIAQAEMIEVSGGSRGLYFISYEFSVPLSQGGQQTFVKIAEKIRKRDPKVGQRVKIIYATADPSISKIQSSYRRPQTLVEFISYWFCFFCFLSFFSLPMSLLVFLNLRWSNSRRDVY